MLRVERFAELANRSGQNAFSDKSINGGLKAGLFDVECYQQLKAIARFPERRMAYGRRVGGGASEDLPVDDNDADGDGGLDRSKSLVSLKKSSVFRRDGRSGTPRKEEHVVPVLDASLVRRGGLRGDGSESDVGDSDDEASRRTLHTQRSEQTLRHVQKMEQAMSAADGPKKRPSQINAKRRASSIYRASSGRASVAGGKIDIESVVKPHYTMADLQAFRDSFNYVDVDLSGMINMEEWFLFLGRMNQKLSPIESQLLFLHIDKDRDGEITMRELLAIVFQKASKAQLNTMHRYLWDMHLKDATERKQRDLEKLVKKKQAAMFADQPGRAGGDDRGHIPDRDYAELGDGGDKLSAMAYAA